MLLRSIAAIVLTCALFARTAEAYKAPNPIWAFHLTSCGQYAEDRKLPNGVGMNSADRLYVSGWISAANMYVAGVDFEGNDTLDNAMLWLDTYCANHAFSSLQEGLRQLINERAAPAKSPAKKSTK
jgi:hypothetical protein